MPRARIHAAGAIMQFRDVEYFQASLERMRQARLLLEVGDSYALAMYCGGLAVECLLRAFRWKHEKGFEGRHDLKELFKESGMLKLHEEALQLRSKKEMNDNSSADLRAFVNDVVLLWNNNLRFASEGRLKSHLFKAGKVRGVKGDPLKKNANDLIEAAQRVVDRGVQLWPLRKKS